MIDNNAIVNIIEKITKISGAPCKKTLQKLIYLIEEKNVNIGCEYGIHFYGPYSSDLDYAVRKLSDECILNIRYTPTKHLIYVNEKPDDMNYSNDIVEKVLEEFANDSPVELELITTALYVYRQTEDKKSVKNGVFKIKGDKYDENQIESAINRLIKTGYIVA